jgi:hypothetical protein
MHVFGRISWGGGEQIFYANVHIAIIVNINSLKIEILMFVVNMSVSREVACSIPNEVITFFN